MVHSSEGSFLNALHLFSIFTFLCSKFQVQTLRFLIYGPNKHWLKYLKISNPTLTLKAKCKMFQPKCGALVLNLNTVSSNFYNVKSFPINYLGFFLKIFTRLSVGIQLIFVCCQFNVFMIKAFQVMGFTFIQNLKIENLKFKPWESTQRFMYNIFSLKSC